MLVSYKGYLLTRTNHASTQVRSFCERGVVRLAISGRDYATHDVFLFDVCLHDGYCLSTSSFRTSLTSNFLSFHPETILVDVENKVILFGEEKVVTASYIKKKRKAKNRSLIYLIQYDDINEK